MNKRISGTKEWSKHSVNCITGCPHNCRYCYARASALRYKHIKSSDEWTTERIQIPSLTKNRTKLDGVVMFPTTHDITPSNLLVCLTVLERLLEAGNDMLIVSKPHDPCIDALCYRLDAYKKQILFRFTIGTHKEDILKWWEPGAPCFQERFECLITAFTRGYKTSVSMEPALDLESIGETIDILLPFITDSIWIGKMNKIQARVQLGINDDREAMTKIMRSQQDNNIKSLYEKFKDNPKIKWKESIKQVVGLEPLTEAGLDV